MSNAESDVWSGQHSNVEQKLLRGFRTGWHAREDARLFADRDVARAGLLATLENATASVVRSSSRCARRPVGELVYERGT